jgi:preprotein translocase subunit SecD
MRFGSNCCEFVSLAVVAVACSLSGCESRSAPQSLGPAATLEVRLVSVTDVPNSQQATDLNSGAMIYLTAPPVITSADVATVQRSEDSPQTPSLTVNLTPAGAKKLAAATTPATGQKLAVIVNGQVISAATVHSSLSNSFRIAGGPIQKDRERVFESLTKN